MVKQPRRHQRKTIIGQRRNCLVQRTRASGAHRKNVAPDSAAIERFLQVCIFVSLIFLHFYTRKRNQEPSVGHYQHGRRKELFNASYHIRLHFHERSPGFYLLSQPPLVDNAISEEKTRPTYRFQRETERIPWPKSLSWSEMATTRHQG